MKSYFPTRHVFSMAALVGIGVAFYGAPAHAQQSELDTLRQQIADLQNRLNALEDAQKASATTAKTAPSTTSKFPLTIGGLFQVHSLNYLSEKVNTGGAGSSDTFRLRRAEVRVTAPSITDRLSGTVMFDLGRPDGTNAPGAFQGLSNNILQDLQVTYKASPVANTKSQLFLDAGQFKTPIGYESALVPTANVAFLERSLIFTGRDRFGTTYGDQRDTGVQVRATSGEIEARLGLFNGFGDRQNSLAASDNKAVLGLVAFKPKRIAGLTIGASGGVGNTGVVFTPTGGTAVNLRAHRNLVNAFLNYKFSKFTLQGEYLRGNASSFLTGTTTNAAINPQGYYIGGSYLFNPRFEVLARYDTLDFDRKIDNATVRDYLVGMNYYIKGQNKLQVNLVRRVGGLAAPTSATNPAANYRNNRLELRTGVQLAF
ncbi:hypothetical protein IAD21_04842 [Abditibacteriota bacterium]|nr:hypothetical protein IAD21_04842 [Abditibacteriota bacterium]